MKTSSKDKSEMFGRIQWKSKRKEKNAMKTSSKGNVRKNAMKTSSKGKSEMLGRMQWKHLAKVSQKC